MESIWHTLKKKYKLSLTYIELMGILTYARILHLKGNSAEILYLAEFRVPFQSNQAFNLQSSVLVKLKPILAEEIWFQL